MFKKSKERSPSTTSNSALRRVGLSLSGVALAVAASVIPLQEAKAQQNCTTLPNPVYFPATTLLQKLMDRVGPILADPTKVGSNNMTVVYFPVSSCFGYDQNRSGSPLTGTATYYTPDGVKRECTMPSGSTIAPDLSAMDVGGAACVGEANVPGDFKEFPGHVETLGFVVPNNSTQNAITATEAHYIMRYAGIPNFRVAPWTDPRYIEIRNPNSSTQLTIAAAIEFPARLWNEQLQGNRGSGDVLNAVVAANGTSRGPQTLGILNSSKWEANADDIKVLAYQPFYGCEGAFLPDSSRSRLDKINVRDGHYPLWTNVRFIQRETANGNPLSPNGSAAANRARLFIEYITGARRDNDLPLTEFLVDTGNIPSCAMYVKRDVDGGPISRLDNTAPCHCQFLELVGLDSGCTQCTTNTQCGLGTCRNGFCEER